MLVNQNGLSEAKGVFDLTNPTTTRTLLQNQNVYRFGLPTGEGAPQGLRGWGVRLKGVWGRVPQWVWATPKVCFCHAEYGSAKPKSVADPYQF